MLVEDNKVARMTGAVVGGYRGLVKGSYYGVDSEGRLAQVPVVGGKLTAAAFLQAVSTTELVILPDVRGEVS